MHCTEVTITMPNIKLMIVSAIVPGNLVLQNTNRIIHGRML